MNQFFTKFPGRAGTRTSVPGNYTSFGPVTKLFSGLNYSPDLPRAVCMFTVLKKSPKCLDVLNGFSRYSSFVLFSISPQTCTHSILWLSACVYFDYLYLRTHRVAHGVSQLVRIRRIAMRCDFQNKVGCV